MRQFTRRTLLQVGTSFLAAPALAQTPSNPEVVIVGAGMAGLAAARTLMQGGVPVAVLEARNRIGGCAYTESATFGLPYDHGCAFIHSASENPINSLATNLGYELSEEGDCWLIVEGRDASIADYDELGAILDRMDRAISHRQRRGRRSNVGDPGETGSGLSWHRVQTHLIRNGRFEARRVGTGRVRIRYRRRVVPSRQWRALLSGEHRPPGGPQASSGQGL
ncbi:MAG: hypothetical protein CL569_09330 [Alphaproteobacteria bacterium]|nr:hypothetical protein [Alphaproteobacteria bacterium]